MPASYTLTVAEVIAETAEASSIVFDVPAEHAEVFAYRPGQFLTLRAGGAARCYSLSSAPHEGTRLKVTVKRTEGGYGSNWLCDNVSAGSTVDVLPPAGVFTPESLDTDLLLLAGGSGITPVMAILKSALAHGDGRVVLLYANRDESSVIFASELAALAREHPERLVLLHWLESVQGLPSVTQLREVVRPYAGFDAFLCGPEPFMRAGKQALKDLGAPRSRIHLERFVSLGGNPFEDRAEAAPVDEAGTTALTVDLDGAQHSFTWPRQEKLLDFLLARGLDAPYSCREGQCSACACRITSGEVKMLNNEVLDAEDTDDGIVLACQSVPLTDEVSVTYE